MAPGRCWQMRTMDWSWWLVNLRPSTSKTISISLTLQAQPLIRERKKKKSDTLTKHIPPAVSGSKGSRQRWPSSPHRSAALQPPPALRLSSSSSTRRVSRRFHQQHPGSAGPRRRRYLPAKCLRWCFSRAGHTHAREATYGRPPWIPLLFLENLRGLRGDRNVTLLFTRLNLIISQ